MRTTGLADSALLWLGQVTNRTLVLPVVMFFPTSRCNSRCTTCDWWTRSGATDLTLEEIQSVAAMLPVCGTRLVVFTGGEPLLRPEVFEIARMFRFNGMKLHLLTSGVLLDRCAAEVAREFSRVIISLDAADEALYHSIRGVNALITVEKGIARLRTHAPHLPITARATLHRANFRELPRLIDHAKALALNGISFLATDISSSAFGRERMPRPGALALTPEEVIEFDDVIERALVTHADDFASRFVAESAEKLRRLPQYYAALNGDASFPPTACNAPWVSAVIEADGAVRPCFFHRPLGNLRTEPLHRIFDRHLRAFRSGLDVSRNPVCERCVCSIKAGWRDAPWH
jgi:MoaA/NifB/PqqE/SkfB family radical SAM enzyme